MANRRRIEGCVEQYLMKKQNVRHKNGNRIDIWFSGKLIHFQETQFMGSVNIIFLAISAVKPVTYWIS